MKQSVVTALLVFVVLTAPAPAHAGVVDDALQGVARSVYCLVQSVLGKTCRSFGVASTVVYERSQGASAIDALRHTPLPVVVATTSPALTIESTGTESVARVVTREHVARTEFDSAITVLRGKIEEISTLARAQAQAWANTPVAMTPAFPDTYNSYDDEIESIWKALSLTNNIDQLGSVAISSPTITDATISGSFTADTLTVSGATTASTTTSVIYDKGGHVCNVKAYGAVGDDSTDNYTAITNAIADCAGAGVVYFPPGVYRISQMIVLDSPVTLEGSFSPRWSYSTTPRASIKPTTPFTGTAMIHVRDKSISGEATDNNGGRIKNLSIDGNSFGSDVHGVHFEGLVRDWQLMNVDISQTSGNGFRAEQGSGSGNPRGFTINGLWIYSPASHGFRATALNDSYIEDVLVVGGALRGFYLSSMGETKINNSRAVFNGLTGLYIDGSSSNGGLQFTDFSTDRNDRHGVRISATGTTTISFNGLLTRRDGPNASSGSETPYAGVALIGTSGNKVAPVVITNLTQIPGINDGGGGTPAPATGLRAEYTEYLKVDGVLWGTTNAYTDDGNNDNLFIEEDTLLKQGYASVTSSLYNQKWVTGSSQLSYSGGSIGVGTSTPSAQLHTTGSVRFANFGTGTLQTDANGNVSVSSDERLKDVQELYTTGLTAVLGIEPILYNWNEESGFDTETLYAGFSAQNIQTYIPEAVGEDKRGFLTLSDRPILASVVTAIKELWDMIVGNQDEIHALKARVEALEEALGIQAPVVETPVSDAETSGGDTEAPDDTPEVVEDDEALPEDEEVASEENEENTTQEEGDTPDSVETSEESDDTEEADVPEEEHVAPDTSDESGTTQTQETEVAEDTSTTEDTPDDTPEDIETPTSDDAPDSGDPEPLDES